MEGFLEADDHALSVELDGEHGGVEVDLAYGVVLLGVPQSKTSRADDAMCQVLQL